MPTGVSSDRAASEDARAAEEDRLAANPRPGEDPAIHRQRAAEHRAKAKGHREMAATKRNELREVRWDLDRARQDLFRYESTYHDASYRFERAERRVQDLETEAAGHRAAMNAASNQMTQAREAIRRDQETVRDNDTVLGLGPAIQRPAERLLASGEAVRTYSDFAARRAEFQGDAQQLATHAANETYRKVHGNALQVRLAPIRALLDAMDKPAASK
ncbi:MAG: hypothetical protein FJZ01_23440 [Candidatus Sericytochromatia bacterium]|nr:hypothetical protein [Candidatus Tanganyikabacteria bacterium]